MKSIRYNAILTLAADTEEPSSTIVYVEMVLTPRINKSTHNEKRTTRYNTNTQNIIQVMPQDTTWGMIVFGCL